MTTWGDYVTKIRRSVFNDLGESQWTDDQFYDFFLWAQDTFCAHTAKPSEYIFDSVANAALASPLDLDVDTRYPLPSDVYDDFEYTSMVELVTTQQTHYFDPIDKTAGIHPYTNPSSVPTYDVFPTGYINFQNAMGADSSLRIKYFAYYDTPDDKDDTDFVLEIPRWSEVAVGFLMAAYALTPLGIQSANIDRWKESADSGNPEHNALRTQQKFMMGEYRNILSQYPKQDRVNYWRKYDGR